MGKRALPARVLAAWVFAGVAWPSGAVENEATKPARMMYGDADRTGQPFSKDPQVVRFGERYLMYYSVRPHAPEKNHPVKGWGIGIAESRDLTQWKKAGEIVPEAEYERNGLCAPGALVREGRVHLFYQTYGNGPRDAICHAVSEDGICFVRNETNPIFRPHGDWNNGRAIDAEVIRHGGTYLLYFATRDPAGKIQMQGVATAPENTAFKRDDWTLAVDAPILMPELPWEGDCVEGASVIHRNGRLFMFYAGNYNNRPQQVGVAVSDDGVKWKRLRDEPFLPHGQPGEWNSSESGHPHVFDDADGRTYLFFQGNNDGGKTWFISQVEIGWTKDGPFLKR
jgi:predicted GH43/DUF377 family glycosyl hydrolase